MDNFFKDGFEKTAGQAIMGFVHSTGLSDDQFDSLKESVKKQIDYRAKIIKSYKDKKVGNIKIMSAKNLTMDIVEDFQRKNPGAKDKVWSGNDIKLVGEMKKKTITPNFFKRLFGAKKKETYSGVPDAMAAYVSRLDKGITPVYKGAVILGKHSGALTEGDGKGTQSYFRNV